MALALPRIPRIARRKKVEPRPSENLELEIYMLLELGFPAA